MKIFKKICGLFLTLILLISMFAGCANLNFTEKSKVEFGNLSASRISYIIGEESEVIFFIPITGKVNFVNLYCETNGQETKMVDNGSGADEKANDGIFTCAIELNNEEAGILSFYVKYEELQSNFVNINCYIKADENAEAIIEKNEKDFESIEKDFVDENGNIKIDEVKSVLNEAEKVAQQLYEAKEIIAYERTETSIVLKYNFGLTWVYTPNVEEMYSNAKEESVSVLICQPEYDWVSGFNTESQMPEGMKQVELLENAGNDIVNMFEDSSLTLYKDDEVSLDVIEEFGKNQVILWQGHGVYGGEKLHSLVCSGQEFDFVKFYTDEEYNKDCLEERIVASNSSELFSSKYIEKYCSDIEGSVVYLGPCESGYDNILAESFINKGAEGVIANTKSILCVYGDLVQYKTIQLMTTVNPDTRNYYTLGEALIRAKEIYGESDASYGGLGAVPTLFGDETAYNYRLKEFEEIYVTDFTLNADYTLNIGEVAAIEPVIVPEDATSYNIAWSSSDENVVTVSPNGEAGIVTAKQHGNAVITAVLTSNGKTITKTTKVRVAQKARDTVLVLDISGSMYGTPLKEMKEAAVNFCTELLSGDNHNNRVGIVFYDHRTSVIDLTDNLSKLKTEINRITDGGTTNTQLGLEKADQMLKNNGRKEAIKNVVIMADGLPNEGKTSDSNSMPYVSAEWVYSRPYASAVIDKAQEMMKRYNLYSLGFFHSLDSDYIEYASTLMKKLASKEDDYYQVDKAEDLQFVFGDISEDISSGSKIVVNIACPVDVSITYGNETLSSATDTFCDKTSFGTLQLLGKDKDIKVLSLDADKEYTIAINGTGEGKMDYSVNYFDENEQLIDHRSFEAVPITETTLISTETSNNEKNVELKVDDDGDGEVDTVWTAGEKSAGEITYEKNPATPEPTPEPTIVPAETPAPTKEPEKTTDAAIIAAVVAVVALMILVGGIVVAIAVGHRSQEEFAETSRDYGNEVNNDISEEINKNIPVKEPAKEAARVIYQVPEKQGKIKIISGAMAGTSVSVKDGETVYIGKDPNFANLVITKEYKHVSRAHCSITYDAKENRYFIVDSSSNGTYFQKMRIIKGKRTAVNANSEILLANEECTIYLG